MPKITVDVPAGILRDIEATGRDMGFKKLSRTLRSLIIAAHMKFIAKRGKRANT